MNVSKCSKKGYLACKCTHEKDVTVMGHTEIEHVTRLCQMGQLENGYSHHSGHEKMHLLDIYLHHKIGATNSLHISSIDIYICIYCKSYV